MKPPIAMTIFTRNLVRPVTRGLLLPAALLLLAAVAARAQDPETQMSRPVPGNETAELVQRIKESMEKIDENLLGASVSGARENLEESIRNIERLLEDTRNQSSRVISDLDTLIQSIKYQKCSSGSGGSPQPQPKPSEQPENQPRSEEQNEELQQNKPPEEEGGEERRKDDERPQDGRGQEDASEKPDGPPPEYVDHADQSGRWGVLPPKLQQDILNFNIEEFPEKYRKWLESYYKRINKRNRR